MSTTIAQAKHETAGWRGQVIDPAGNVLTRTVNLYPTSDKAITAAQRLWDFQQQRSPTLPTGGAA